MMKLFSINKWHFASPFLIGMTFFFLIGIAKAQKDSLTGKPLPDVDSQPLAANVKRLVTTLENIGYPIKPKNLAKIRQAIEQGSSQTIQSALSGVVDLEVVIKDLESPIEFSQTRPSIRLFQNEHRPLIVKVINIPEKELLLQTDSPNAGAVFSGTAIFSLDRQQQTELGKKQNEDNRKDIYLDLDFYRRSPLKPKLSGLQVEYVVMLVHCTRSGKQSPKIWFEAREDKDNETAKHATHDRKPGDLVLEVDKALPVVLEIRDDTQQSLRPIARLEIRDRLGRIYPNQPKRLAPDFFFQPHIYRRSGESLYLTPGEYRVRFCRGPEYKLLEKTFHVSRDKKNVWSFDLQRWIQPELQGLYSGDHHIHAAGCAHYTSPTQGVTPAHMYRQVAGEGLNVGCVLTWGPCFDFQRKFFSPETQSFDNRETLLKYDIEVSGFGSQALGHVCLLNLKDQTYPESDGTKTKGWPTWTTPVMRWAKKQGGYTGYAHSASGLAISPQNATRRIFNASDADKDGTLTRKELGQRLLPFDFSTIDRDKSGKISFNELVSAHRSSADQLPNFAIPEMNGVGAMEICVSAVEGVCDFISAMDTARIQEWNTWYHLLNCGFPIKVSGETDFPCMSSVRVGKGRVYVDMGRTLAKDETLDFATWCEHLAKGRSYVSDGFAHALEFSVNGQEPGKNDVSLDQPGKVKVRFAVAFAPQTPSAVAHGTQRKSIEKNKIGDTVQLHHPREHKWITGGTRKVELVVNGRPVISKTVKADGKVYKFEESIQVERSSWIAIRQFPQLHTNPVNVIVDEKPIRASRKSALWCIGMTELVWQNRQRTISPKERPEALETFQRALKRLAQIASESDVD